jgi:hypothetical protein
MKSRYTMSMLAACAIVTAGIALSGCDDPSVYTPAESQLPISSERILNQVLIGNAIAGTNIYDLYDNTKGSFLFNGFIDGTWAIGLIGRNCQLDWTLAMTNTPRYLSMVPSNAIGLVDAFVIVGGVDTDSDGASEQAFIQLVGANEQKLREIIIKKADADVWLNSVASIDALHFVAAGGARKNGVQHPYLMTFDINADSTLSITNETLPEDTENEITLTVVTDPSKTTSTEFVCYHQVEELDQSGNDLNVAIRAIRGPKAGGADFVTDWNVTLKQNNNLPWSSSRGSFVLHDGTLYIAGSGQDKKKPLGNGYWSAGFIAAVSTNGTVNWFKMVSLSSHSDSYKGVFVTDNALYAAGTYNGYYIISNNLVYGLALVSIFDPATGNEVYHLGLGSKEYASNFNAVYTDGTKAFCAGYTNYHKVNESSQGWFVEVKIDSLGSLATAELPQILEDGGDPSDASKALPIHREHRSDRE